MSETIYFNGKKYDSVAEMPSNVRQIYDKLDRFFTDEDRDGIPDIIQSGGLAGVKEVFNVIKDITQASGTTSFDSGRISVIRETDTGIFINGKEYASIAEMPDYVRQEYERIINSAEDGREDIFDESWRQVEREDFFVPHDDEILNQQISKRVSSAASPIETVDTTSRFLLIAAVAILIMGCLAAAWFYFL